MKKNIIILIIAIALIVTTILLFLLPNDDIVVEDPVKEELLAEEEEVVIKPELRVKSVQTDLTFVLEEFEKDLFLNEKLIALSYLDGIHRLLIRREIENNQVVMVYEDQTLIFDMNGDTYTLNYDESYKNDVIILKAGELYVNVASLSELFNVDYSTIEEPFLSIQLDFNSEGLESYDVEEQMIAHRESLPEKINMTWEAVYSRPTNVEGLYDMPGLDIISPVWYDLTSGTGEIKSKKQDDYIDWAKANGYILWPAITNGFDTDMTHELISSLENRTAYINKLVDIYKANDFPGINIDFENIYKEDKDTLSQFIGELTAAFHRNGILVSMDVTFAGGSDTWSKCYDRKVLGDWLDYLVIMSYDQHWGSSPVSGTVAGIEWLEKNLSLLTKEVDSDKIIMGIPFYMRVWFERPSTEVVNSMKVTSDAITMHKMESILAETDYTMLWDELNGQSYISYIDPGDNAVKKIWIEDEVSLRLKVELVHKYGLKGIASWRRGYELQSIWPVLDEALENR